MTRHIFILLDVDDTLVDFDKSVGHHIVLMGGNSHWAKTLRQLQAEALKLDIYIHFGIATAKPKFLSLENLNANQYGDRITGRLLEEKIWLDALPEPHHQYGLKELIDPELIFFVGELVLKYALQREKFHNVKVKHALEVAKDILENRLQIQLSNQDGFLIDNDAEICKAVDAAGFNSICVERLVSLNKAEQKQYITKLLLDEGLISKPQKVAENTATEGLIELGKHKIQDESKEIPEIALNQNSFFHAEVKKLAVAGGKKKRVKTSIDTECSPDEAQRNPGF